MTWKQFQKWCNDRAMDGCWGSNVARVCIAVLLNIRSLPFWQRENAWKKSEKVMLEKIINPTNQKIEEMERRRYE